MARMLKLVFYCAVALLAMVFALLNAETVHFNYYFGQWELPLSLLMAITTVFGAALGVLASLTMVFKAKRQTAAQRKHADLAERELAKLRALPHAEQDK